jgi:hypothetical protein
MAYQSGTSVAYKLQHKIAKLAPGRLPEGSAINSGLYNEVIRLRIENQQLREQVAAMQADNAVMLEIREIPRDQAKDEIRQFFKDHHGEKIYPSDIMESLALDYDLVYEICEELEKDGEIKGL